MRIDSFSGGAASLGPKNRTAEGVLAALKQDPRVSCFDLSELPWLRKAIERLERQRIIVDDKKEPYPWVKYTISKEY